MATWDDVREIAMALPEAEETTKWGNRTWAVRRGFVWERPLRPKDVEEVGEQTGPILGARVAHEHEKQALLAEDPEVFFTTSHFDGYPAILARLASSPAIPDDLPGSWRTLLTAMTASDPERRPTALQVTLAATTLRETDAVTADIAELLAEPTQAAPLVPGTDPGPLRAAHLDTPTEAVAPPGGRTAQDATKVLPDPTPSDARPHPSRRLAR